MAAAARGGKTGARFLESSDRLGRKYNSTAMRCLQMGEHAQALELLQSAESLIAECNADPALDGLKGLTYNNLGCYFRREGMPMEALKWLRQAHDIEQRVGRSGAARARPRSSTYARCTRCSASTSTRSAVRRRRSPTCASRCATPTSRRAGLRCPGWNGLDQASMVAIAYHNIAVEQEYLARYADAAASYRKGAVRRRTAVRAQVAAGRQDPLRARSGHQRRAGRGRGTARAPRAARRALLGRRLRQRGPAHHNNSTRL